MAYGSPQAKALAGHHWEPPARRLAAARLRRTLWHAVRLAAGLGSGRRSAS